MADMNMKTGSSIKIEFTYADGTTSTVGTWVVPLDIHHQKMMDVGADLGWHIVYEMAKQPTKTVVGVRVCPATSAVDTTVGEDYDG